MFFFAVWAGGVFFFLLFGRGRVLFLLFGQGRVLFFAVWAGGVFFFAVWARDRSSLTYPSAWLVFKRPNNKRDRTAKKNTGSARGPIIPPLDYNRDHGRTHFRFQLGVHIIHATLQQAVSTPCSIHKEDYDFASEASGSRKSRRPSSLCIGGETQHKLIQGSRPNSRDIPLSLIELSGSTTALRTERKRIGYCSRLFRLLHTSAGTMYYNLMQDGKNDNPFFQAPALTGVQSKFTIYQGLRYPKRNSSWRDLSARYFTRTPLDPA